MEIETYVIDAAFIRAATIHQPTGDTP